MIHNVKFNDIDSYKDLGLILSSRQISTPKIKESYVKVDGADGSIDLTEAFGDVHFEDRKIKLEFSVIDKVSEFWNIFSNVQNLLHGKRFKITFDDDEDFYYVGRVSIDKWKTDKVVGKLSIEIVAEPYKYWRDVTEIYETVATQKVIRLFNMRKAVYPTFRTSVPMNLELNGKVITSVKDEDFYSVELKLHEGDNWLKVTGTGTIKIKYQMRGL